MEQFFTAIENHVTTSLILLLVLFFIIADLKQK